MTTQPQRKKVISLKIMKGKKKPTCDHQVVLSEEEKLSVANR
jgi:hypothetical protein